VHEPLEQVSRLGHAWPQLPQLLASVLRLTQVPLHRVSPEGQVQALSRLRNWWFEASHEDRVALSW
jgi:hypothetical protein